MYVMYVRFFIFYFFHVYGNFLTEQADTNFYWSRTDTKKTKTKTNKKKKTFLHVLVLR